MSTSSKKTSIELPQYQRQTPSSFNTPWGTARFNAGGWLVNPTEQQTITQAAKIRSDLLNSLGLGGNISQDAYTKEYMNEILRLSQPKTENALIGRGLGGSTVYKDALTDLITKASTQAILGGQQYKQNDYSMLSDYLDKQYGMGNQLAQLAAQNGLSEEQMNNARFLATLPYLANVRTSGDNGLAGLLSGIVSGSPLGLPGMITGGATGYFSNKSSGSSTPYMMTDYYAKRSSPLNLQNLLSLQGAF